MVIKTTYSARARDDLDVHYRCAACGFVRRARVSVHGRSEVRGRSFGHDTRAAETAREEARMVASEGGRLAIALKPCPRCGEVCADATEERRRTYVVPGNRAAIAVAIFVGGAITLAGCGERGYAPILLAMFGLSLGMALGFHATKTRLGRAAPSRTSRAPSSSPRRIRRTLRSVRPSARGSAPRRRCRNRETDGLARPGCVIRRAESRTPRA